MARSDSTRRTTLLLLLIGAFALLIATPRCSRQCQMDPTQKESAAPMTTSKHKYTNKLAGSTSPYLLQHAHNPVNWYPWGKEALDKAKKEDKPIFLSVGYSSCHWCHVMERESFENEAIAKIMNEHFVSIKVDREERPDIDEQYMTAVQMMTGSGGWPMSVFLTPDLKPYLGGTYFPPEDKFGRPGFPRVLRHAAQIYRERREDVGKVGDQILEALRRSATGQGDAGRQIDPKAVAAAAAQYAEAFDPVWGGFSPAPKFPPTGAIALLLRHHRRTGDKKALEMATLTLDRMATGGMYDQLGGGFHRYSTDTRWLVPHFEKMLYDNALLAMVYLDAYRVTGKPLTARTARGILDYVLRDMTDETGGFHSAEDADSEGIEGKFYVWTPEQIKVVLGREDAAVFIKYYDVTEHGNFEEKNILNVPKLDEAVEARVAKMKPKLLAVRANRIRPGKDDKVLADWNGLMISAMARGYQVLDDERYLRAAERAAGFILTTMRPDDGLLHTYRAGRAHIDAFLDDYAFMLQATVDLYEATFDPKWIGHARSLADEMTDRLWDEKHGGFFATRRGQADLLVRRKDAHDSSVPAGNAVAAHALLRLARLTDDKDRYAQAEKTLGAFANATTRAPVAFARLLCAIDFLRGPSREIVVAGDPKNDATAALLGAVRRRYLPNAVVALVDPESGGAAAAVKTLPFLENRSLVEGRPAAYVCEDYACKAPVVSAEDLTKLLEPRPPNPIIKGPDTKPKGE